LSYAANSQIYVTFPVGTGFSPGYDDSSIVVGGTEVGTCGSPDVNRRVTCFMGFNQSIAANTPVTVTFNGLTNAAQGPQTLTVATTSDPATQNGSYTVSAAHNISTPTVSIADPTDAAGARTIYTIGFTTSSSGKLSYAGNSEIYVTFPVGTGFSPGYDDSAIVVGGVEVGTCGSPDVNRRVTCFMGFNQSIAANTAVTVVFNGLTNPAQGPQTLTVSTTSDPTAQTGSYTVSAAHQISAPTVSIADPTNVEGARTVYSIGFTTSPSGKLSYAGNSEIYVTFPVGTGFSPGYDDSAVTVGGVEVGRCSSREIGRAHV